MQEVWKDIPGYEGAYQASSLGRIRSLDRLIPMGKTHTLTNRAGRILRPACSKRDRHLYVVLGHGKAGSTVHSLVASAFLGPAPAGCEVRHLDGDAQNNRIENLAYGTRAQNILDVYAVGRAWKKLNAAQVLEIRSRLSDGETGSSIAREFGMSESAISAIKTGRRYAWLT